MNSKRFIMVGSCDSSSPLQSKQSSMTSQTDNTNSIPTTTTTTPKITTNLKNAVAENKDLLWFRIGKARADFVRLSTARVNNRRLKLVGDLVHYLILSPLYRPIMKNISPDQVIAKDFATGRILETGALLAEFAGNTDDTPLLIQIELENIMPILKRKPLNQDGTAL
jgi:hypothetical protein